MLSEGHTKLSEHFVKFSEDSRRFPKISEEVQKIFRSNIISNIISHVLNEQGTGYEHIFSSVQTFNIDLIEKWGTSSERASKN